MGKRTGNPRGRPRGAKNKRTVEVMQKAEQAAASIAEALGADVFEGDAHAFLMSVYKDKTNAIELRLDAAKAAAPYEKPRLNSNDTKLSGNVGYTAVEVAERDPIPGVAASSWPADGSDPPASRH